jgi:hypothetical protein
MGQLSATSDRERAFCDPTARTPRALRYCLGRRGAALDTEASARRRAPRYTTTYDMTVARIATTQDRLDSGSACKIPAAHGRNYRRTTTRTKWDRLLSVHRPSLRSWVIAPQSSWDRMRDCFSGSSPIEPPFEQSCLSLS